MLSFMARRRRNREIDRAKLVVKGIVGLLILIALGTGGVVGFGERLLALFQLVLVGIAFLAVCTIAFFVVRKLSRRGSTAIPTREVPATGPSGPPIVNVTPPAAATPRYSTPSGTPETVKTALGEIDWYQFEKFCAALLRAEGFQVERKGGAQPDGGVDLIASNGSIQMLVQCKHWRTWTVQEKVIRELLGSMTHFRVSQGALYTLKGWTPPSQKFAAEHNILLVDANDLSRRALAKISQDELQALLSPGGHHCPKCESLMVWRTGDFEPFWGCSKYPRCRSVLRHTGAR